MPITYPLDFPTSFGVSEFTIGIAHAVSGEQSPFTYEEQLQVHQGVAWDISFTISDMDRAQAEEYNAFIMKLQGRYGTFTMSPPGSETIRGAATGTVLVNGADQTGHDLNVDGLPLSTTGVFLAGDFIQLGTGSSSRLHKVVEDADSNGSGEAGLLIVPKIVTAPSDNSTVVYSSPKGVFRAKSNLVPISIKPPNIFTVSLSAREVR